MPDNNNNNNNEDKLIEGSSVEESHENLSEFIAPTSPKKYLSRTDTSDADLSRLLVGLNERQTSRVIHSSQNSLDRYVPVYREYEEMERDTVIQSALEIYADDATGSTDLDGKSIIVTVPDSNTDKNLKRDIEDLISKLDLEDKLWNWSYQLAKYGDHYLQIHYSDNSTLPKIFDYDDPACIVDVREYDQPVAFIEDRSSHTSALNDYSNHLGGGLVVSSLVEDTSSGLQIINPTDMIHMSVSKSTNYSRIILEVEDDRDDKGNPAVREFQIKRGSSMIESVRYIYRIIRALEDSLIFLRVNKSTYVRLFNIEVQDSTPEVTAQTLNSLKDLFDSRASFNTDTGYYESDRVTRPHMDPIFNPVRNGKNQIDTVEIGGEVDVRSIVDMEYFNNKLYAGLKIPKAYLGMEECFRYDTQVELVDGTSVSIGDMAQDPDKYLGRSIYSVSQSGVVDITTIAHVKKTRLDATFVRVHLSSGSYVDVTPDHLMMLDSGDFKPAGELVPDDSLMTHKGYILGPIKVVRVEVLDVIEDAYDLGVTHKNHTFYLESGIFVHNSLPGGLSDESLVHLDARYSRSIARVTKALSSGLRSIIDSWLIHNGRSGSIGRYTIQVRSPESAKKISELQAVSETLDSISGITRTLSDTLGDYVNVPEVFQSLLKMYLPESDVLNVLLDSLDTSVDEYAAEGSTGDSHD